MFGAAGTGSGSGVLAPLARRLEAEQERWFCWLPVCFGCGIAAYFALPGEPSLLAALLPLDRHAGAGVRRAARARRSRRCSSPRCWPLSLGFALAKLRVEWVRAPVLEKQINAAEVRGFVELIEPRPARGQRLTLRVTSLGDLAGRQAARRACASPPTGRCPGCGRASAVRLRATLMPPPGPALPGDYDFGRQAWFAGIGAVGYSLSPPSIDAAAADAAGRPARCGRACSACARRSARASPRRCRARPAPSPRR